MILIGRRHFQAQNSALTTHILGVASVHVTTCRSPCLLPAPCTAEGRKRSLRCQQWSDASKFGVRYMHTRPTATWSEQRAAEDSTINTSQRRDEASPGRGREE